ncbi:hypothetical protein JCM8208_003584 [Rhodotorula glutinis]
MSLVRVATLALFAASFAPSLAHSELKVRQSDETDALDTAWTVLKDLGSAAITCPVDCGSFLLSTARCSGQFVTQLSYTAGLECICEDVPTGLDECSACTSARDSTEATSGGTALASDWIDQVCGILGMERSSSVDDSSTSAATTAAPETFTGVDTDNAPRTTSFITNGVPVDNVIPLESRISYLSVASASSASIVSLVSAASASAAAAAAPSSSAAAPSSTSAPAQAQGQTVTVTAASTSVDSVSAALASASAVLASASSAAAAAAEASAKEGDSSGVTSGRAQLGSLVSAGVVVVGALAAW